MCSILVKVLFYSQVDVAIIEVGMGGLNDSTNVVMPLFLDSAELLLLS